MATKIQLRGGTAAQWTAANPILSEREMGIETDTRMFKFGDGITEWDSLDYASSAGGVASIVAGTNITVDDTDPANPIVSASGGGGSEFLEFTIPGAGDYTLLQSDNGKEVRITSATDININVPALTEGTQIAVKRLGAGQITFVASGTSITASSGALVDSGQSAPPVILIWSTTTAVDLENGNPTIDLTFSPVASPSYARGKLVYNSTDEDLKFYNNESDIVLPIGEMTRIRVYNSSGSTITKNSVVYFSGVNGATGLPTIALAKGDADATQRAKGWANHDIENNTAGWIVNTGPISGLNTSGMTSGDEVYLSTTIAGAFQNTIPSYPDYSVRLGVVVVVNSSTGTIIATNPTYSNTRYTARTVKLALDQANADVVANTLAALTGFTLSVKAGRSYKISAAIGYQTAVNTTGARFVVTSTTGNSTRTQFRNAPSNSGTAEFLTYNAGFNLPATASAGSTTGSNLFTLQGMFTATDDQVIGISFASEVSASAVTALAGSWMTIEELP